MIYHIRRSLRKSTSTQWYLDNSNRYAGTYCGAEATDHDITWKQKTYIFNGWQCCPDCEEARKKEKRIKERK